LRIQIDFDKTVGTVKPMHGINNAPIVGTKTGMFHYLKEAGIPYTRFNDMGGAYGGNRYVDIANLFRDFNADPSLPESYDFTFTDWLFEHTTSQGAEVFFRLGPSIENDQHIKAYYIYPPADDLKWAKICEGIIKHYNYGWADGYHYNIQYWEIWNEPDNEPEIKDNQCWKGSKERFFALYETAANYLKEKFPHLKIGGYGSCGFYALTNFYAKSANSSKRTDYFVEFFKDFIDYITSEEHKAPLDFFSWHSYATSEHNSIWADFVREYLDSHGLEHTESILNEWNPGVKRRGTDEDACHVADMLITMHHKPVELMTYYNGESRSPVYSGLFDSATQTAFPAYYSMQVFNELYRLGGLAETVSERPVLAATDGKTGKLLIANKTEEPLELELSLSGSWHMTRLRMLEGRDGPVEADAATLTVPAQKVAVIDFEK